MSQPHIKLQKWLQSTKGYVDNVKNGLESGPWCQYLRWEK